MCFNLSALVLGVGVIIFVSSVDDVMLNRRNRERVLHSTTEYRELVFHCWYGWSVFMLPLSFMSAIIAATINVKVYTQKYLKIQKIGIKESGYIQNYRVKI